MSANILQGISNCDTVKKAKQWLAKEGIDYQFRDYKKQPPQIAELQQWARQVGWQNLINKRGTTWRKLPPEQHDLDKTKTLKLLTEHPSMIKRPLLINQDNALLGFSPATYTDFFAS